MDERTFADVDAALVWWFRTAMDVAADPHRPARSRMSLLMNGCDAWQSIIEHRATRRAGA
jgi:hypothetical protein